MSWGDNNTEEGEDAREPRQDKKDGQYGGLRCRERKRQKRPRNSRQLSQALDCSSSYYPPSSSSHIHHIRNVWLHAMFDNTIASILALPAPIHGSCPVRLAPRIIIVLTGSGTVTRRHRNLAKRTLSTCVHAQPDPAERSGTLLVSCC